MAYYYGNASITLQKYTNNQINNGFSCVMRICLLIQIKNSNLYTTNLNCNIQKKFRK